MTVGVWVADSSPLILLAKIGLLPLASGMAARLVILEAFRAEIDAGPAGDIGRILVTRLIRTGGPKVYSPTIPGEVAACRRGETAVTAAALERITAGFDTEAVLDDGPARRAAKALGVPTVGTLGILIRAKESGHVAEIAPLLHRLREAGQWLTGDLCRRVALGAGEAWP